MKKITLFLLSISLFCKTEAESLQTLTVLNLSSTNIAGLAWVDKHGSFHALNTTNIVTEAYVSGLLEGYQIGSDILSNFVALGNGIGVLTNDGLGNISWVIPSGGGSGNFMSDGSVPMTGDFDGGGNNIINIASVILGSYTLSEGTDPVGAANSFLISNGDGVFSMDSLGEILFAGSSSFFAMQSRTGGVGERMGFYVSSGNYDIYDALTGNTPVSINGATGIIRALGSGVGYNPIGDDGTSALIQSSSDISAFGSYWIGGVQGWTGSDAGGTFVGGIKTAP